MKRLRVRLKASGQEALAASFGRRLRMDGLDIPSKTPLEPGLELSVLLLYCHGEVALEGVGRVRSCAPRPRGGHELSLFVRWSPISTELLRRVLSADLAGPEGAPAPVDSTADVLQVPDALLSKEGLQRMPDVWQTPPPPASERAAGLDALPPEVSTPALPADALESGEVTPLARIELVRHPQPSEPVEAPRIASLGAVRPGTKPGEARGQLVLGIDCGTRAVRASCMTGEEIQVVPTRRGMSALPSVVHIDASGRTIVGDPALRRMAGDPAHGMLDARRLLGVPSPEGGAPRMGPHGVQAEELTALLLKEVREASNLVMPDRMNRAVLTVPGWSGPATRAAVLRSGQAAGIHVERLVSEAAACAVAHAHAGGRGTALVVSMGAGVLDVAVVRMDEEGVEVLAAGGAESLAGVEFDRALRPVVDRAAAAAGAGIAPTDFEAERCAEALKQGLALQPRSTGVLEVAVGADALRIDVEIERSEAEALWAPLVEEVRALVQRTLDAGGADIDALLLAGGSLGLAPVRLAVRGLVPQAEPFELDFDAAAKGAAIVGARIARGLPVGLTERLFQPIWLGIEGKGRWGLFPARAAAPARRALQLPGRQEARLAFVQGLGPSRRWLGAARIPLEARDGAELEVSLSSGLLLELRLDGRPLALSGNDAAVPWYVELEEGGRQPGVDGPAEDTPGAGETISPDAERRGGWLDWLRRR